MTIFFTADTHFGHEKVIGYSNRPFADADAMDEALLAGWAAALRSPKDRLYHLGDVAFGGVERVTRIAGLIKKLPGEKFLIPGNHDSERNLAILREADAFVILPPRFELDIRGVALPEDMTPPVKRGGAKRMPLVLDHYPLMSWNRSGHGALHLHGHCHACVPATNQRLDVGVDAWDYTPASLEAVLRRLAYAPPWIDPRAGREVRAAMRDASPFARLLHGLFGR